MLMSVWCMQIYREIEWYRVRISFVSIINVRIYDRGVFFYISIKCGKVSRSSNKRIGIRKEA